MHLTNYGEGQLAALLRGDTVTLPTDWYWALCSSAGEIAATELTGTGYARQATARSLTAWAGTQGAGTTLASSGTSHRTSNNADIDFGTSGSAWGTANYLCMVTTASGATNIWAYAPLDNPLTISSSQAVNFPAGTVQLDLGVGAMSDYLANKLIDLLWRGQAYTVPGTLYGALYAETLTSADLAAEVTGGGYARCAVANNATNFSIVAGELRNAGTLAYPSPTGDWAEGLPITHEGWRDAASLGNLIWYGALDTPLSARAGGAAPSHEAGSLIFELA